MNLELSLQIERGRIDPMTNGFPTDLTEPTERKKSGRSEEKVTIILDKERGIFSQRKLN